MYKFNTFTTIYIIYNNINFCIRMISEELFDTKD